MAKIHFLDVGCADCTIINSEGQTHVVDCNNDIKRYNQYLPGDKQIRVIFITHHHYDHFEGLHYLYDNRYNAQYIILSPYERRYNDNSVQKAEWDDCQNIISKFEAKGTKVYKPFRQDSFDKPFWNIDNLKYWMIGPESNIAKSETRELHDASLVFTLQTNRKCCFTGDASDTSLNWISKNTSHFCNDVLHASHHGSINGADLDFIKKSEPGYTIISTKSGVHESVPESTALARYRQNTKIAVYRTDTDGSKYFDF